MRFKALKIGKDKEEPEEEIIETNETTVSQIAEMEEQINNKTKDLEETTSKLQELSETVNDTDDEEEKPKPHGPLSELSIEPEDKMMDIDLDINTDANSLEGTEGAISLVEVGSQPAAPAEPQAETTEEPVVSTEGQPEVSLEDDDDSFNNLFSSDEEEVNPLSNLINSLPDVTAQELADDLKEIKEIIQEWQKS